MPGDKELDTKEEIALEEAKIELEKKKADLWKHRFDTYLAIARDLGLIIVIVATTWFNIMSGNYQKNSEPTLEAVKMSASVGEGFGSGGGRTFTPTPALRLLTLKDPTLVPVNITKHAGLALVSILAFIFLVLPRLKKKPHK